MPASMEKFFYLLHTKISNVALRYTTPRFRSLVEHSALLLAVSSFCVVLIAHRTFVYRATFTALSKSGNVPHPFPAAGTIPSQCLRSIPFFDENAPITNVILRYGDDSSPTSVASDSFVFTLKPESTTCLSDSGHMDLAGKNECFISQTNETKRNSEKHQSSLATILKSSDMLLYSYSQTKGFLLLPPSVLAKHEIIPQYVVVSVSDPKCFGEPFLQSLVLNVIGPDTIIMNWFIALHDGDGYLHNTQTEILTDLHFASNFIPTVSTDTYRKLSTFLAFKLGVLLATLFLFCITTTLVSFTLRETQKRTLEFTFLLQAHVRNRRPFSQLVFRHIVESLVFVPITVGIIFFLIEIFEDKFLATSVLGVVWMCELYSVIGVRTMASIRFFPRVFFLYFSLFHAYFFSCPYGFSYASLSSTVFFLVHSMLFFWGRYELPALQSGAISQTVPRMPSVHRFEYTSNVPRRTGMNSLRNPNSSRSSAGQSQMADAAAPTNISRVSSGNVLFLRGDEDDDSYMTFMNGEVVMQTDPTHQNHSRQD